MLRRSILPLQAGLTRRIVARISRVVAQIIVSRRIGLPQRALLGDDLPSDALRGMDLAHDALVAQRLLRRDRQRQRRNASHGAGTDRKAAGALRQKAEPRTVAAVDFDPPDLAVGVRIQ